MANEIVHQLAGVVSPRSGDRLSRRGTTLARHYVEEVRLAGLQVDGALALAGHLVEGLVDLDTHRRRLAGDDVGLNLLLSEIEATAVRQCQRIQSDLYRDSRFGL
jgi:hypothetical protein